MKAAVVIATSLCLSGAAVAQDKTVRSFYDGNKLLAQCSAANTELGECAGYITAIADAMSGDNAVNGAHACIDWNVSNEQVRDVVVAALRRDPATLNLTARSLVA